MSFKWSDSIVVLRGSKALLGRQGLSTALVVLLLAVGIGMGGAVMGVARNATNVEAPEVRRLYWIHRNGAAFDPSDLDTVNQMGAVADGVGGYIPSSRRGRPDFLVIDGKREFISTVQVSSQLFRLLGDTISHGRSFSDEESNPSYDFFHAAVLSWSAWQTLFRGDPGAIGGQIEFHGSPYSNGTTLTIVGVLSRDAVFPVQADIFVPLPNSNDQRVPAHGVEMLVRLRPGTQLSTAQQALGKALNETSLQSVVLLSFQAGLLGGLGSLLKCVTFLSAATWILVCCNVLVLALVRAKEQEKRLAVATALGANPTWMAKRLLVSIGVLCCIATGISYVAAKGAAFVISSQLQQIPTYIRSGVPIWVWVIIPVGTVISFTAWGLVPIITMPRVSIQTLLGPERHSTSSRGNRQVLIWLLGTELAITTFVVVLATGVLAQYQYQWRRAQAQSWRNVTDFQVLLPRDASRSYSTLGTKLGLLIDRLNSSEGHLQCGLSAFLPTQPGPTQAPIERTGRLPASFNIEAISPGYFQALSMSLVAGREFTSSDMVDMAKGPSGPVILSQSAAAQLGMTPTNAVGSALRSPGNATADRIIGIVENNNIMGDDIPTAYIPVSDLGDPAQNFTVHLVVRSSLPLYDVLRYVRQALAESLPTAQLGIPQPLTKFFPLQYTLVKLQSTFGIVVLIVVLMSGAIGVYATIRWHVHFGSDALVLRIVLGASRARAVVGTFLPLIAITIVASFGGLLAGLKGVAIATNSTAADHFLSSCLGLVFVLGVTASIVSAQVAVLRPGNLMARISK